MSIELGCAPVSPKVVAGADKTSGRSKVKPGDESDVPPEGGFAAILTALDPKVEPRASLLVTSDAALLPVPSDSSPGLTQAGQSTGVDLFMANQVAVQASIQVDPALVPVQVDPALLVTQLPSELAMLLVPVGGVGGDNLSAISNEKLTSSPLGGVQIARHVVSADKSELTPGKLPPPGAGTASDVQQNVQAMLDQMAQGLQGITHKARGLDAKSGAAASLAESRLQQQVALTDVVSQDPAMSNALLTSGLGDGFVRLADRVGSKSSIQVGASGMEGSWGQSAFQSANNTDAPSVLIDPATQSFEATVADTVSFWVKQGVQNAELKLDGLDGESIAVSISLNGDEAHIGFRTDKPETRQMLEGAVAHLKDLLTSEGLVLSGVSVGASGQDGAAAQDQSGRQGPPRTTFVSTEAAAPVENLQRMSKSVGRALDLYV